MGVSEQEAVEIIISFLESNLTDPATGRAANNKKWIYDDLPREDITSTPRIGVYPVTSSYESLAIGFSQQLEDATIEIQVVTQKTDKFRISDTVYRAEQLVDLLSIQIRDLIRSNHNYFVARDIQHLIPETNNRAEVDGLVVNSMTFKLVSVN